MSVLQLDETKGYFELVDRKGNAKGEKKAENRRKNSRFPISLPTHATVGGTRYTMQTMDVGSEGVFVVTDRVPSTQKSIVLTMILPPTFEKAYLTGIVVRTVTPKEATMQRVPAGIGIRFDRMHEQWSSFLVWAAEQQNLDAKLAADPVFLPKNERAVVPLIREEKATDRHETETRSPVEEIKIENVKEQQIASSSAMLTRKRHDTDQEIITQLAQLSEAPIVYRLRPPTLMALRMFRAEALDLGGVVLIGVQPVNTVRAAIIVIVHPGTGKEFRLLGKVEPSNKSAKGVAVKFVGLTERIRQQFEQFAAIQGPSQWVMGCDALRRRN
ncbi:MAG: PilZ domain-containing protein, partial [Bacteroides sp.]|nr:PilZ domain-containing protein [Bacteroides sp.]